jgi:hypothetical protein
MDWRTVTAVWGAGLSTLLALQKLVPERPILALGPARGSARPPYVLLQLTNPSQQPLFIVGCRQIRLSGPRQDYGVILDAPLSLHEDIARVIDAKARGGPGAFPLIHVPPQGTVTLRISRITEHSGRVIVLLWHRNWWPLSFKMWSMMRVTSALAEQINPR